MNNQNNVDANKVIGNLLNKLATAEYAQEVLETKVSELTAENEKLKKEKENASK